MGARGRLLTGLGAGVVVAVAAGVVGTAATAVALGWVVTSLVFLATTWAALWPMDAPATRGHAVREDAGRRVTHVVLVAASLASLVSVGALLGLAPDDGSARRATATVLGALTPIVSWAVVHTVYTVRYAEAYYGGAPGGIDFGADRPRYSDFAYLAITLGMTYQVSDTDLQTSAIRRTALGHALLSYLFGAVVLGVVVNLVAGLAG